MALAGARLALLADEAFLLGWQQFGPLGAMAGFGLASLALLFASSARPETERLRGLDTWNKMIVAVLLSVWAWTISSSLALIGTFWPAGAPPMLVGAFQGAVVCALALSTRSLVAVTLFAYQFLGRER